MKKISNEKFKHLTFLASYCKEKWRFFKNKIELFFYFWSFFLKNKRI